jgi:hypothetical protein
MGLIFRFLQISDDFTQTAIRKRNKQKGGLCQKKIPRSGFCLSESEISRPQQWIRAASTPQQVALRANSPIALRLAGSGKAWTSRAFWFTR